MAFILVIDANRTLAGRASDALNAAGHACGWVTAAPQAVTLLHWRAPDLILLDQGLPGADGGALPQTLRRAANSPDLPILLLTTGAMSEPHDSSIADHIEKPFDPRYLVWRVNHALDAHLARVVPVTGAEFVLEPPRAGEGRPSLRSVA